MYFEHRTFKIRLSCDFCQDRTAVDFEGSTLKEAYDRAFAAGWKTFSLLSKARCPICSEKIKPGNFRENRRES